MRIEQFIEKHREALGRPEARYERLFAEKVLAQVPGLDLRDVETQTGFRDFQGKRRAIDFTIREGDRIRIAIEVDGWDKTGRRSGMTRMEFHDWSLREVAMTAQGWTVLRFANSLLNHQPDDCVRAIELTLEAEREIARRLDETGDQELSERVEELSERTRRAGEAIGNTAPDSEREQELAARIRELEAERERLVSQALPPDEGEKLRNLAAARRAESERLEGELSQTIGERNALKGENRQMKVVVASVAVILIAVAVIVALVAGGDDGGTDSVSPATAEAEPSGSQAIAAARCDDAVDWSTAKSLIGEEAVIRGPVVGAVYAEETDSSPTYLNIGRDYPDESRFVVVIFGDDRQNFRGAPEDAYDGKDVAVEGEVSRYNGVSQIIANHRNDISIC